MAALLARDAGVGGPGAADELARALGAATALFAVSGYALARTLLPEALAPYRALFVLPLGAAASGIGLTVLGFAGVPFKLALGLTLALGVIGGLASARSREPRGAGEGEAPSPPEPRQAGEGEAPSPALARRAGGLPSRQLAALACATALIVTVALIPSFRSGFATVTGKSSDAHQVTGSATFLQHNYPSARDVAYPIDEVRAIWNSKYPIFYPLAATSSLAGLEPWQALMSLAALLLALTALGVFVLARHLLSAGAGLAALAMALAVLDEQVLHLALHPYYNQLWGLFTLPFTLVLAREWARDGSPRTLALFALMTALGAFAYPLMLPFPLVAVAGFQLLERRERRLRGERVEPLDPRRLWRGWRSLAWMLPLGAVLILPLRGVVEKTRDALELLTDPGQSLSNWGGDITTYPPFAEFFGLPDAGVAGALGAAAVVAAADWTLWRLPRATGLPLLAMLGGALLAAAGFAALDDGQYFYFKLLSFAGGLVVACAAVALGRLPWRPLAALALTALTTTTLLGARDEIGRSFDQLQPETLELREWSKRLPEGASIRLDTPDQLWRAYMLSDRPLGSIRPIRDFPHVSYSFGADYSLTEAHQPRPPDAAGRRPLFENADLRLWKLSGRFRGKPLTDTTSRRLVPIAADRGVE